MVEDDNMEFFKGRYQSLTNLYEQIRMLPYTGFLLMFPAWTYHSVEMNMEDRDRISIAFNLVDPQQPLQQYGWGRKSKWSST